jgi:hypothetical protein
MSHDPPGLGDNLARALAANIDYCDEMAARDLPKTRGGTLNSS